MRLRFPLILLLSLVGISAIIAVYTIKLHRAEHSVFEDTLRESRARSINLLAARIEQVVKDAIIPPFAYFSNINEFRAIEDSELASAIALFSSLEKIFVLNEDFTVAKIVPSPRNDIDRSFNEWLAARIILEKKKIAENKRDVITFTERIADRPLLFALRAIKMPNKHELWLLITFDFEKIYTNEVQSLLKLFEEETKGTVILQDSNGEWNDEAINWPIGHLLPGWMLVYVPTEQQENEQLARQERLFFGITGIVFTTLLLAAYAVWREYRREYALINLRKQFIANVSHELRTPITLIRMYAETLFLRRVADESKQHDYHQVILKESERLSLMVNTILNFSALEQEKKLYSLTDSDLMLTVEQTLEMYARQFEHNGIKVELRQKTNISPVLHDRNAIMQILLNLIDNSAKYGDKSQPVTVELEQRNNRVYLSVIDYGPGVPSVERKKLLRPFERGQNRDGKTGAGIGLALVNEIAKLHHAKFDLLDPENHPGLKATLEFTISHHE